MIVIVTWSVDYIKQNFRKICAGQYEIGRKCFACGGDKEENTVVGHGKRRRSCYTDGTRFVQVRRGRCKRCEQTFTFLPCFLRPYHHYGVEVQAEALDDYLKNGKGSFAAAAPCLWGEKCPEGSTVRRWFVCLGNARLARKAGRFFNGSEHGGSPQPVNGLGAGRETKSKVLRAFFRIWAAVRQAAMCARGFVVGSLRLGVECGLMFLLLLWHECGRGRAV